jgi:hypothetical protein
MTETAVMGDFTPWLDYIDIGATGPGGEKLYVSALGMVQRAAGTEEAKDVVLPAIDRSGNVIGHLIPPYGLVIDGQPVPDRPVVTTQP